MKNICKIFSVAVLIGLVLGSCSKYEDGPSFTLLTKKMRLTGIWNLDYLTMDGERQAASTSGVKMTYEFKKDGTGSNTFTMGTWTETEPGTWSWSEKKDSIIMTDTTGFRDAYLITRLTNSELVMQQTDEDGTAILELSK